MWGRPEVDIPAGWQVADGTNGTIDMLTRYPFANDNDITLGVPFGLTNHDHTFTGDGHEHDHLDGPPNEDGTGSPAFQRVVSNESAVGTTDTTANQPPSVFVWFIQKVA